MAFTIGMQHSTVVIWQHIHVTNAILEVLLIRVCVFLYLILCSCCSYLVQPVLVCLRAILLLLFIVTAELLHHLWGEYNEHLVLWMNEISWFTLKELEKCREQRIVGLVPVSRSRLALQENGNFLVVPKFCIHLKSAFNRCRYWWAVTSRCVRYHELLLSTNCVW